MVVALLPLTHAGLGLRHLGIQRGGPALRDPAGLGPVAEQAHTRGIRVLVDLVPNHTSSLHPWFSESRYTRHSPKRHW